MKTNFSRIMVALDLSSMDRELIRYLAEAWRSLGARQAYFVHIMPDFTAPGKEDPRFRKLFNPDEPLDENIENRIQNLLAEAFGDEDGIELTVEVIEGKPYQKLMHWLEVKDVDLLVLGKKPSSEGSGITAKRVARNTGCHVLMVAPRSNGYWRQLLVPIDFSEHAARAVRFALDAKLKDPERTVEGLYIVEMPLEDYYNTSSLYAGYRPLLKESAEVAYKSFLKTHRFQADRIDMAFVENDYGNVSGHIAEYAMGKRPDLIVMGAQGHSRLDRFLFGSVTEKLIEKVSGLSILLIR